MTTPTTTVEPVLVSMPRNPLVVPAGCCGASSRRRVPQARAWALTGATRDEVGVHMGETGPGAGANTVRLRGRVSTGPVERELPSGSVVVAIRLSIPREASPMTNGSRQTVDWVDCSAWGAAQRRAAARWCEGDVVEIDGALRRRSSRGAAGFSTRVEVEILGGRRVRRADT